jgi:hypothetical protein
MQRRIFEKIISCGQTGADQGALDAALELNHPCGGWCPKGRKSEAGRIPSKYPVIEHASPDYSIRTEANVVDSDGTLIFTYGEPTGGTKLTVELAREDGKPLYIFDFEDEALNQDPEVIWEWGLDNNVYVLNVAGPRESKNPGTQVLVKAVMLMLLEYARKCYSVVEG